MIFNPILNYIAMKNLILPVLILLLAWSCSPSQKAESSTRNNTIAIDSTEYDITIIDMEFDTWYLMNYSPSKDFSNDYYRTKNHIGVSNWNSYFDRGKYQRVVGNHIFYDYPVDYGIDVNRKLYWYFKYIEDKYDIRLLR
jgi:hypothetical protein